MNNLGKNILSKALIRLPILIFICIVPIVLASLTKDIIISYVVTILLLGTISYFFKNEIKVAVNWISESLNEEKITNGEFMVLKKAFGLSDNIRSSTNVNVMEAFIDKKLIEASKSLQNLNVEIRKSSSERFFVYEIDEKIKSINEVVKNLRSAVKKLSEEKKDR